MGFLRSHGGNLCFLVLILCTALWFPCESASGAILQGRVINQVSGRPVSGIEVSIAGSSATIRTDSDGTFTFTDLGPGKYALSIADRAYRPLTKSVWVDAEDADVVVMCLEPIIYLGPGITVTGTRVPENILMQPRSVSVIGRDHMAEMSIASTADALREESGVTVQKTTYGHGSPILRGLMGNYILLLYNGIRLNKPSFRYGPNQYINTVDAEAVSRIEVVKGPLSVMYGSDAIGGVINFVPADHPVATRSRDLQPWFSSQFSTADNGVLFHAGTRGEYGDSHFDVVGTYRSTRDLDAGGAVGRQNPTGWKEFGVTSRVVIPMRDERSLTIDYVMNRQSDVPRYDKYDAGTHDTYLYDPQDRYLAALTFESYTQSRIVRSYSANVSFQFEDEGRVSRKVGDPAITEERDKVATLGASCRFVSFPFSRQRLIYGFETYYDKVRSERQRTRLDVVETLRSTFPDNAIHWSIGAFLQDDWDITHAVTLTTGLRVSGSQIRAALESPYFDTRSSYTELTSALTVSIHPSSTWNLYTGWARGFRAPNWDDAIVLNETNQGFDAPNPGLRPEYSDCFELGAKYDDGSLFISGSAYYTLLNDLIDRRPGTYDGLPFYDENGNGVRDDVEVDIYQKMNVGKARIYGFENSLLWRMTRILTVWSSMQWTWGENRTVKEPLSRIPPLAGQAGVQFQVSRNLWAGISYQWSTSQHRISRRDIADSRIGPGGTDGWGIVNLKSGWEAGRLRCIVLLENLMDRLYKTHGSGIYSPGRNFVLKIAVGV